MAVITLLTDFGTADAYVGIMKGVILSRCPGASIVDLTHQVPPGDVHAASYLLGAAWRYFPAGSVHVAVVDPGVGSDRRVLAARVEGQTFVAPDNGLISAVLEDVTPETVVSVEYRDFFLPQVSRTFHGRDVLAPTAAAIACGVKIDTLGPAVEPRVKLPRHQAMIDGDGEMVGHVIHVDRFGNLITSVREDEVEEGDDVMVAGHVVHGLSESYSAVQRGELLAIIGSTGRLVVSVPGGSAAEMLGVGVGTQVKVVRG